MDKQSSPDVSRRAFVAGTVAVAGGTLVGLASSAHGQSGLSEAPGAVAGAAGSYRFITLTRDDSILTIRLNNPPDNFLAPDVIPELAQAFDNEAAADDVRAVILTADGDTFSNGAGIQIWIDFDVNGPIHPVMQQGIDLIDRIQTIDKAVIAAINGRIEGGALELASACDFRIAADNARFWQSEVANGAVPGWGGIQLLQRLVGRAHAKDIALRAQPIGAEEAYRMALVKEVVPRDQLMARSRELAIELAAHPAQAIGRAKLRFARGFDEPQREAITLDAQTFDQLIRTPEGRRALDAAIGRK